VGKCPIARVHPSVALRLPVPLPLILSPDPAQSSPPCHHRSVARCSDSIFLQFSSLDRPFLRSTYASLPYVQLDYVSTLRTRGKHWEIQFMELQNIWIASFRQLYSIQWCKPFAAGSCRLQAEFFSTKCDNCIMWYLLSASL
jgi:hypothetical protein